MVYSRCESSKVVVMYLSSTTKQSFLLLCILIIVVRVPAGGLSLSFRASCFLTLSPNGQRPPDKRGVNFGKTVNRCCVDSPHSLIIFGSESDLVRWICSATSSSGQRFEKNYGQVTALRDQRF